MSRQAAPPELSALSDLQLLRLPEAAAIARLSERTLRRALCAPQRPLRYHRFGRSVRIAPDDLAVWLRAHAAVPAVAPAVLDTLSPAAREVLDTLGATTTDTARSPQRTAMERRTAPGSESLTGLDSSPQSSVHVSTDDRSEDAAMQRTNSTDVARTRPRQREAS
jgi:hypothetical protein